MSDYYSQRYYPQGYYAFHFLITPNELENLLQPYHLIITNAHVPADYVESTVSEYIELYRQLYEMLINGEKLSLERDCRLLAQRCVVPDLSVCRYGGYHKYEGKEHKNVRFDEPHPHFSPFALGFYRDDNQKLCTSTRWSYIVNAENIMGIEMNFAKKIKYRADGEFMPTNELESYSEYIALKKTIMKITKPLCVMIDGEQKKTAVRISEEVKKHLNNFYFFKNGNITAV